MKIAFDIGGVLSKYPEQFCGLIEEFCDEYTQMECFVITDQHPKEQVVKVLKDNGLLQDLNKYLFHRISEENVYCADYAKYGEMCKAILLRDLKIDIFIDDFMGYMQWDYSWGKPPLRLLVMPDATRPYHDPLWFQPGYEFGKEVYKQNGV